MHSFTGDEATAQACLGLGLHISFAGMITYKKNDDLRKAAKIVPLERLLVETDSPYLSPEPVRGRTNEPANVRRTGAKLAEVHGVSVEDLAAATTANARRLFALS
jgi:TatD DNase family protein